MTNKANNKIDFVNTKVNLAEYYKLSIVFQKEVFKIIEIKIIIHICDKLEFFF